MLVRQLRRRVMLPHPLLSQQLVPFGGEDKDQDAGSKQERVKSAGNQKLPIL